MILFILLIIHTFFYLPMTHIFLGPFCLLKILNTMNYFWNWLITIRTLSQMFTSYNNFFLSIPMLRGLYIRIYYLHLSNVQFLKNHSTQNNTLMSTLNNLELIYLLTIFKRRIFEIIIISFLKINIRIRSNNKF